MIFQILRRMTDRGKRKNLRSIPDRRMPFDHDMRMNYHIVAECDIGANDAVRTHANIAAQRGPRINNGGRVDKVYHR